MRGAYSSVMRKVGRFLVDHVVGVNTVFVWVGLLVTFGLAYDPTQGPRTSWTRLSMWEACLVAVGIIGIAYGYWRIVDRVRHKAPVDRAPTD